MPEQHAPPANPNGNWHWAAALYKAVHLGEHRRRHLWERVVFLVGPVEGEEPRSAAERMAREKEHEYVVVNGGTVRWVLQVVERVEPVFDAAPGSGTEVYWHFFEKVDPR